MVCHNLLFTNFFLCDPDLMPCSIYNYWVMTDDYILSLFTYLFIYLFILQS